MSVLSCCMPLYQLIKIASRSSTCPTACAQLLRGPICDSLHYWFFFYILFFYNAFIEINGYFDNHTWNIYELYACCISAIKCSFPCILSYWRSKLVPGIRNAIPQNLVLWNSTISWNSCQCCPFWFPNPQPRQFCVHFDLTWTKSFIS